MNIVKNFLPIAAIAFTGSIISCEADEPEASKSTPAKSEVAEAPKTANAIPESDTGVTILGKSGDEVAPEFKNITEEIHGIIAKKSAETEAKTPLKNYKGKAPSADNAEFDMIFIKGGDFKMGSPESEKDRLKIEGPQRDVKIEPFWMGKIEVTWELYEAYQKDVHNRNKNGSINRDGNMETVEANERQGDETLLDAISQPTPPFHTMHYEMGGGEGYSAEFPAISMTQHAASKFCEWLSAQTGEYYRLPTEAEWEYACRAGTTTAYHFGDDPSQLPEYAWFKDNSQLDLTYEYEYNKVGQKKPNPWGLHDMYGNVAEWVIDTKLDGGYAEIPAGTVNPVQLGTNRYDRVVRGGHFELPADKCRSASRIASSKMWKIWDPNNPQSIWYLASHTGGEHNDYTHGRAIGFRIVRPVKVPSVDQMHQLWNSGPGVVTIDQ